MASTAVVSGARRKKYLDQGEYFGLTTGTTNNQAQLGLSDRVCAIKELVVCIRTFDQNKKLLDLRYNSVFVGYQIVFNSYYRL